MRRIYTGKMKLCLYHFLKHAYIHWYLKDAYINFMRKISCLQPFSPRIKLSCNVCLGWMESLSLSLSIIIYIYMYIYLSLLSPPHLMSRTQVKKAGAARAPEAAAPSTFVGQNGKEMFELEKTC
jgi:hypothetical protein